MDSKKDSRLTGCPSKRCNLLFFFASTMFGKWFSFLHALRSKRTFGCACLNADMFSFFPLLYIPTYWASFLFILLLFLLNWIDMIIYYLLDVYIWFVLSYSWYQHYPCYFLSTDITFAAIFSCVSFYLFSICNVFLLLVISVLF